MTCGYPYGPQIQLFYDQGGANPLSVTCTEDAGNFRSDGGDDRLSQTGYDRTVQPATIAQIANTAMGAIVFAKPVYRPKFAFAARLQLLSDLQAETAIAMFERQRLELKLVTLYDRRLVTREPAPRTRAKVGVVDNAPTIAGIDLFFAQYKIWITQYSEPYRAERNNNYLDFEAVEVDSPIPPTNDL